MQQTSTTSTPPPVLKAGGDNNAKHHHQQQVFPPLNYSRSYFTQWLLQSAAAAEVVSDHNQLNKRTTTTLVLPPEEPPPQHQQKTSNNHYTNHVDQQQVKHHQKSKTNRMELIQLLAINALEFTAPVYSFLNKETMTSSSAATAVTTTTTAAPSTSVASGSVKHHHVPAGRTNSSSSLTLTHHSNSELKLEREIIQLSGHPGSFAPAGPNSIWKKMPPDSVNEAEVYECLRDDKRSGDEFRSLAASYISRAEYKGQTFIELEDLVTRFNVEEVNIMDLKLGTRTFLESEVQNNKPRADLFEKLKKLDEKCLTEEERENKTITKLRYMSYREELSSTRSLGFRIEGLKQSSSSSSNKSCSVPVNFHRLREEDEIRLLLRSFCGSYLEEYVRKLTALREILEKSNFFRSHEMIGSSLLLIHDSESCGVWIIDFAKTIPAPHPLSHREPWQLGNHEDGVLTGIDNIIRLIH